MLRRDFLRRLTATAAGLLVADDALELLTHRKVWAGHSFDGPVGLLGIVDDGPTYHGLAEIANASPKWIRISNGYSESFIPVWI